MTKTKAKSTNALMKYLRDKKHIDINGTTGKNDLRNIGYYHGYKGYRFFNKAEAVIPYTNFQQIKAIYDYDMKLKAWFYPHIMFIETALKNRVLESIIATIDSADFVTVYNKALNVHKEEKSKNNSYKEKLNKKLTLRQNIYSDIASNLNHSAIVKHFYYNDKSLPLWAIFELITLGEFGVFYEALNTDIKLKACESLKLDKSYNTTGNLLTKIIFAIKDLRNAIAHNKPIFDVRFKDGKINSVLFDYLQKEFKLPKNNAHYGHSTEITFENIIDYFLLVIFLLKNLGYTKTELNQAIKNFTSILDSIKTKVPIEIYKMVIPVGFNNKVDFIKNWISSKKN